MNKAVARNNLPSQGVLEVDTQANYSAVMDTGIECKEILPEVKVNIEENKKGLTTEAMKEKREQL